MHNPVAGDSLTGPPPPRRRLAPPARRFHLQRGPPCTRRSLARYSSRPVAALLAVRRSGGRRDLEGRQDSNAPDHRPGRRAPELRRASARRGQRRAPVGDRAGGRLRERPARRSARRRLGPRADRRRPACSTAARAPAPTSSRTRASAAARRCRCRSAAAPARGAAGSIRVRWVKADLSPAARRYKLQMVRVPFHAAGRPGAPRRAALDTTDHPAPTYQDVLLHTAADERKLRAPGFSSPSASATCSARTGPTGASSAAPASARSRGPRRRSASRAAGPATARCPRSRQELKALAEANPGLVRTVHAAAQVARGPRRSWASRSPRTSATRPTGGPSTSWSARTTPASGPPNEAAMEWALELVQGYKSGDAQLRSIVQGARTYIIPVFNVDGFNATIESEGLNPDGSFEDPVDSGGTSGSSGAAPAPTSARPAPTGATRPTRRSRASRAPTTPPRRPGIVDRGVDPNRNYGVEWGGPGTEGDVDRPDLPRPHALVRGRDGRLPRAGCATTSRRC